MVSGSPVLGVSADTPSPIHSCSALYKLGGLLKLLNLNKKYLGLAVILSAHTLAFASAAAPPNADLLQGRDLDGDLSNGFEAYYDVQQNISWLKDANHAVTSGFASTGTESPGDVVHPTGFWAGGGNGIWTDGRMTWDVAQKWASTVNVSGVTGWRLPSLSVIRDAACNPSVECGWKLESSELGFLQMSILGNAGTPDGLAGEQGYNVGPFVNLNIDRTTSNWLSANYEGTTEFAWKFIPAYGNHGSDVTRAGAQVWLVRDGDVALAVPEPGTWLLMAVGLFGVGLARTRKSLAG
jgi:hypothetical protein